MADLTSGSEMLRTSDGRPLKAALLQAQRAAACGKAARPGEDDVRGRLVHLFALPCAARRRKR